MASAIIGALRVNLGIDSAQFESGIKKSQSVFNRFGVQITLGLETIAKGIGRVLGAIPGAINDVISSADKLGDVADRLGVPVEALQELRHAAERGGMAVDNFDVAFRRFIRRASEAAQGTGAAKGAFEELGISLRDNEGRLKSSEQLLSEVADAMQKVPNQADKLRLAFKMFDTDGAAMVNVLANGSAGLNQMREEARTLGIVLSDDAVRGAQAFKDNLDTITKAKDGLITKLTAHLLPSLELLSEKFLGFVNDEAAVTAAADGIGKAFSWVGRQAAHVALLVDRLRAEIGGLVEAAQRLNNYDFSGAWQAWTAGQDASAKMRDELDAVLAQMESGFVQSQGQIQRRISAAFGDAGREAGETFAGGIADTISSDGSGGARVRIAFDAMAAEAARIFEQTRTPLEAYQAQIARLNELLAAGAINQDTYNRAVTQAQDAFSQAEAAGKTAESTFASIGQSIGQTFANAFQGLIDGSKKVKDVLVDLLKQLANMALNSAFQALFGGGMGGGGGLLGGLFKGLFGFARGGTIMPGGAGGIDSQLVAFRKSPNERVDITKPGQMLGGGQSVDVRVSVDKNGDLKAYVERTAGRVSAQVVQAAAPGIAQGAVTATQRAARDKPGFFR